MSGTYRDGAGGGTVGRWWRRVRYRVVDAVQGRPWLIAVSMLVSVVVLAVALASTTGMYADSQSSPTACHGQAACGKTSICCRGSECCSDPVACQKLGCAGCAVEEEARNTAWHTWEFVGRVLGADDVKNESHWLTKSFLMVLTLLSLVLVGAVVASLTETVGGWMRRLQRGRSQVVEKGHTIVAGWTPNTPFILRELIEANASEGGRPIVLLGTADALEMEQELRERLPKRARRGSRIIVRSGSVSRCEDLQMVAADRAKALLLLPPDQQGVKRALACFAAIKASPTISAWMGSRDRYRRGRFTVVAPVGDHAGWLTMQEIDQDHGKWVRHEEVMSTLMAHAIRQSGLAAAFEQLLSFEGSELYLWPVADRRKGGRGNPVARAWSRLRREAPEIADLTGLTFQQVQHGFVRGTPLGVFRAGQVTLNPDPEFLIQKDDELIVLADDNTSRDIRFERRSMRPSLVLRSPTTRPPASAPLEVLVIGIGSLTPGVLQQLDPYLPEGSRVRVITTNQESVPQIERIRPAVRHMNLQVVTMDAIHVGELVDMVREGVDAAMLFPDGPQEHEGGTDIETVHRLLQLREALRLAERSCRIVTEIVDDRNLEITDVARPDDAIVSDRIVSLYCLQLAQQPRLEEIYRELLQNRRCGMSLQPVERFLPLGQSVDMHVAIEAVSRAGGTLAGYRRARDASERGRRFGIEFNPARDTRFTPEAGDCLIVLGAV